MNENYSRRLKTIQKNIWLTFLGVVAALAIALSVFYAIKNRELRLNRTSNDNVYKQQLENQYQMALFRLCDSTKNADANLSKLSVAQSPEIQKELLLKIQSESETALGDLSTLPLDSEISGKASRFFNQLGDYCSATAKSLTAGKGLSAEQRSNFKNLQGVSGGLLAVIEKISLSQSDRLIINALENNGENYLNDNMRDMQDNAFDYPQLIYDGPFSESVVNKKLTLSAKKMSTEKLTTKLRQLFEDYDIETVEYVGGVNSDTAQAELFEMTSSDGTGYSVEMLKDGRVLTLSNYNATIPDGAKKLSCEECAVKAGEMAAKLGYDVVPDWISKPLDDNTIYVNLIARQGKYKLYPDHVKMLVDIFTGRVVGVEAFAYLVNHTERALPETSNLGAATEKLGDKFVVTDTNFAVIPLGNEERVCYEFKGTQDVDEFYVYFDMERLEEVEILKIINDKEGYTVI